MSDERKDWIKLGAITGVVIAVIIAGILSAAVTVLGDIVIQLIAELWSQTVSPDVLGFGFLIVLLAVLVILMPVFAVVEAVALGVTSKILHELFEPLGISLSGYRAVISVSAFSVVLVFSIELLAMFVYSVFTGDIIGLQGISQTIATLASFIFDMVLVVVSAVVASVVWTELLKNDVGDLKI